MKSVPASTDYTYRFVASALPDGAKRLLEVGCGQGELAERLARDGFEVVAIDSDEAAIAAAVARGVDARLQSWPAAVDGNFDAILFTRSLHHIHELNDAVAASMRALRPDGRVIVEDFRAEGGSNRSAKWYSAVISELMDGGALADDTTRAALLEKIAPPHHQDHELHASSAIASALEQQFDVTAFDAAYYFRYLEPHMRQEGAAKWLLDVELERIAAGEIDPLGKRFIAKQR